jgi:hypothetical protein
MIFDRALTKEQVMAQEMMSTTPTAAVAKLNDFPTVGMKPWPPAEVSDESNWGNLKYNFLSGDPRDNLFQCKRPSGATCQYNNNRHSYFDFHGQREWSTNWRTFSSNHNDSATLEAHVWLPDGVEEALCSVTFGCSGTNRLFKQDLVQNHSWAYPGGCYLVHEPRQANPYFRKEIYRIWSDNVDLDDKYFNLTTVNFTVRKNDLWYIKEDLAEGAINWIEITWDTTLYPTYAGKPQIVGGVSSKAKGDPHITNIHGERFDINTAGTFTFIQIPRGHTGPSSTAALSVWGKVDAPTENCKVMWIHELNIAGSRVGGEYQVQAQATPKDQSSDLGIFLLTAGNTSTTNPSKFASVFSNAEVQLYPKKVSEWALRKQNNMHIASIKFPIGMASLDVDLWKTKTPHPWIDRFPGTPGNNHIDLNVQSLAALGTRDTVGGLLGSDDHSSVSKCKRSSSHTGWQRGERQLFEVEEHDDGSSSILAASM